MSGPPAAGTTVSRDGVVSGSGRAASGLRPFDVLGNYQLLQRLGGGGMAEVWLARATLGEGVDKLVAFKTVRPEFGPSTPVGSMFLNEAKVSATLQHPSLVQVFDFGEAAGRPFLGMERVHGRDLAAVIQRLRGDINPPPVGFVVGVVLELVKALEHVHRQKDLDGKPLHLVHRDVTPGNVMVTPRSEVKLMDFGVASTSVAEEAGVVVGKLAYISPDQAIGRTPEPAWDLFGAAVVLYELLTLKRPYAVTLAPGEKTPRYQDQRIRPSSVNPGVPPALDVLVAKATQLDAAKRPGSASELRAGLEAVQQTLGPCDLGATVSAMFGRQLAAEDAEVEALMVEARRRAPRAGGSLLLRPFRALRRRVAATSWWAGLSRHPLLLRALAVGLLGAVLLGGLVGYRRVEREARLKEHLRAAEAQARAGRTVGPGGDQALDHLLAANALSPGDPRVAIRLAALADLFEELGALALSRGNEAEASAHYQAALAADGARAGAAEKLKEIEQRLRASSKKRVVTSP